MRLRPARKRSVILNVTSLIDVLFLLLIFFMVSTTFDKQTQLKVDLPKSSSELIREEKKVKKISITIDAQGNFYA
ncbi:MAG: biopolymer transporter ExbD, partial [Candidatus Latescibacterota bacterium]